MKKNTVKTISSKTAKTLKGGDGSCAGGGGRPVTAADVREMLLCSCYAVPNGRTAGH